MIIIKRHATDTGSIATWPLTKANKISRDYKSFTFKQQCSGYKH